MKYGEIEIVKEKGQVRLLTREAQKTGDNIHY